MVRAAPDLLARPAVCGHPTDMILTRARTLLRPCFARLLAALVGEPDGFAAGAFHARPLRWRSKSRRARNHALVRQSALRPRRFAPTIVCRGDSRAVENKTHAAETPPPLPRPNFIRHEPTLIDSGCLSLNFVRTVISYQIPAIRVSDFCVQICRDFAKIYGSTVS